MTAKEFPFTNYMYLHEWREFKENYYNERSATAANQHKTIGQYLRDNSDKSATFRWLIDGAFLWEFTPQGSYYWEQISKRTKPLNNETI